MSKFSYQAFNDSGKLVSGTVDADSDAMANNLILARGLIPSKVKKEKAAAVKDRELSLTEMLTPIKTRDKILMTKQIRTMLKVGVPMIKMLQILEDQTEHVRLRSVISSISKHITEGSKIHEAFAKHPTVFPPLYCAALQAGEASGSLSEVLDRLIYIMEHEHKIRGDIRAALQYPIFVMAFLTVAFFFLLIFVIPKFVHVFKSAKIKLPMPTQMCILLYEFWHSYWYLAIAGAAGTFAVVGIYLKTENGKYVRDTILLKLPLVGELLIKTAMSRFASIFSILQYSGVQILESFRIIANAIGNKAVSREFDRIREQIEKGSSISGPLKAAKYFTPMVVNMIAIGEKTEKLDEMLSDVAQHYDAEVEYAMKTLSEYIGPVLTICMAAIVGFFALAIMMPMWDLAQIPK